MTIILFYIESPKKQIGTDFTNNRRLEAEVKREIEVTSDTNLIFLRDFYSKIENLKENGKGDANDKIVKRWIQRTK